MAYRVPAGVRVGGKAIGGRFVSLEQLATLLTVTDEEGADAILDYAAYELDRAAAREERLEARFQDDPKRYGAEVYAASLDRQRWESLAEQAASDIADIDDAAPEWEVGFEYESGPNNSFDLNIRMRREDGEDMGRREMLRVVRDLRANLAIEKPNPVPPGYLIAYMAWRQTGRHTKGWVGSKDIDHDLSGSLAAPLLVTAHNDLAWTRPEPAKLRAGSVRRL